MADDGAQVFWKGAEGIVTTLSRNIAKSATVETLPNKSSVAHLEAVNEHE